MQVLPMSPIRWGIAAVGTLGLLVLAEGWLVPAIVKKHVNHHLQALDGYTGEIGGVEVSLLNAAIEIATLGIRKESGVELEPFLNVSHIAIELEWSGLIRGEIVCEVFIGTPTVTFVDGPSTATDQFGLGPDWAQRLRALTPFQITAMTVSDGQMRVLRRADDATDLEILKIDDIEVEASNLANRRNKSKPLHAKITGRGLVQRSAVAELNVDLDPLTDPPRVSVDAKLTDLPLPELNALLREYARLDAEAGTFDTYVEFASANGRFDGYVKPLIQDAEFLDLDEPGSLAVKAWEGLADLANTILENPVTERSGARIPLSGELTAVEAELIPAIFSVLRNAFIEALSAAIEGSVKLPEAADSARHTIEAVSVASGYAKSIGSPAQGFADASSEAIVRNWYARWPPVPSAFCNDPTLSCLSPTF